MAEGLSNKAIASRLQLSVRTVESHVRHALTKLALDNRTQLATWAGSETSQANAHASGAPACLIWSRTPCA